MPIALGETALMYDYTIKVAPFGDILHQAVLYPYILFSLLDIGFDGIYEIEKVSRIALVTVEP
jgi:hypothetical protein